MFKKYSSIENHYREKFIENAILTIPEGTGWVLHEKIHGANFSVIIDKNLTTSFGSRNGITDGNAFNQENVFAKDGLLEKCVALAKHLFENADSYSSKGFETVQLVGEIFGGSFNGIKSENNAVKIQKGVFYSPENHWMLFDVMLVRSGEVDERHPEGLYSEYLSVVTTENLVSEFSIPMVPKVGFFNTLTDALSFDVESFVSVVSMTLGYPKIEGNVAEGVVIKPYSKEFYLPNGDRCVIKKKTEKFKERGASNKELVPVELSEDVKEGLTVFSEYLTQNRVDAAKSKFADFDYDDIGPLIKEFVTDAIKDFAIEHPDKLVFPNESDFPVFKKEMNKMAVSYLKKSVLK